MQHVDIIVNPDLKRDDRVALHYYKRLERLFMTLDLRGNQMSDTQLAGYRREIGRRQRDLQSHGYEVPFTVAQAQKWVRHFGGEPDLMAV